MRQWTLKAKLRLALALMWLGLTSVGAWTWGAMETRATMRDARKTGLLAAKDIAKLYHAKAQSGAMREDEAKKTALATLASMRHGTAGYVFVVDSQLVLQMHPTLADMVGKSIAPFLGIEPVNQAVNQIDEVTQQNAALVEEAAAAPLSLEEQAQLLCDAVASRSTA